MSRRRGGPKGRTQAHPWEPFTERVFDPEVVERLRQEGAEPEDYRVFRNNRYQVMVRGIQMDPGAMGIPDGRILHLSVKRLDKAPIRDWRAMQRIKNELVGEECEGVEMYPAESRLVDEANQYHLWVVPDPTFRFAVGFRTRFVSDRAEAEATGARQRPLGEVG